MIRRKALLSVGLMLAVTGFLFGTEFWERPYREWKKGEVEKMLNDSPWADTVTIADQIGGKGSGVGGDKELYSNYVVRFFSALPVRQAYARTMQMMNNYDTKSEAEQAEIDAKFSRVLKLDLSKTIIVALEFSTNDQERRIRVNRYLQEVRVDLLKQSCYLISDRLGRVQIQEYYAPSPDGTGAKFVFPRVVGDKPVITAEDKDIKFDFYVEPLNQRVFVTFKVKNMIIGGEIAI